MACGLCNKFRKEIRTKIAHRVEWGWSGHWVSPVKTPFLKPTKNDGKKRLENDWKRCMGPLPTSGWKIDFIRAFRGEIQI
jgi:hypothetical protein